MGTVATTKIGRGKPNGQRTVPRCSPLTIQRSGSTMDMARIPSGPAMDTSPSSTGPTMVGQGLRTKVSRREEAREARVAATWKGPRADTQSLPSLKVDTQRAPSQRVAMVVVNRRLRSQRVAKLKVNRRVRRFIILITSREGGARAIARAPIHWCGRCRRLGGTHP